MACVEHKSILEVRDDSGVKAVYAFCKRLTLVKWMAEPTGLEPATSSVTGKRSNQIELRLLYEMSAFSDWLFD